MTTETTPKRFSRFKLPVVASDMMDEGIYGVIDQNNKILCGARLTKDEANFIAECVNAQI